MIKKEIKNYLIELLVSIIIIIIGYINNTLYFFGVGLFFLIVCTTLFLVSIITILIKYKKKDRKIIEKEIDKSIFEIDNIIFTDDYIYLYDSFNKIYYKDIVVIDVTPSFIFDTSMSKYAHKYSIYLKNNKKYSFKIDWQDQVDDEIKRIISIKNSKVFYGRYKNYKNK